MGVVRVVEGLGAKVPVAVKSLSARVPLRVQILRVKVLRVQIECLRVQSGIPGVQEILILKWNGLGSVVDARGTLIMMTVVRLNVDRLGEIRRTGGSMTYGIASEMHHQSKKSRRRMT